MKIEIRRPHPDYPYAFVHVPITANLDDGVIETILEKSRLTPLGRWEPHIQGGHIDSVRAPVLIEDEHTKPKKTRKR
jgi:hypothetical protein